MRENLQARLAEVKARYGRPAVADAIPKTAPATRAKASGHVGASPATSPRPRDHHESSDSDEAELPVGASASDRHAYDKTWKAPLPAAPPPNRPMPTCPVKTGGSAKITSAHKATKEGEDEPASGLVEVEASAAEAPAAAASSTVAPAAEAPSPFRAPFVERGSAASGGAKTEAPEPPTVAPAEALPQAAAKSPGVQAPPTPAAGPAPPTEKDVESPTLSFH